MRFGSVLLVLALLAWPVSALSKDGSSGGGDDGGGGSGSSGSGSSSSVSSGGSGGEGGRDNSGTWSINPSQAVDPVLATAWSAIGMKDWAAARVLLLAALAKQPDNATYHNLYADVIRKGPGPYDMDLVLHHYAQALRIDSSQRGSHRYLGEAYLSMRDLTKARAHLAALDRICLFGCPEFTELGKSIANYEASQRR